MLSYEFRCNNDLILWLFPKNEFYSVLFWSKLLSYRWYPDKCDIDYISNQLSLKYNLSFKKLDFENNYWKKFKILIYWKDKRLLSFFVYYYENNTNEINKEDFYLLLKKFWILDKRTLFTWLSKFNYSSVWGVLLWYPKCCIKYHTNIIWTLKINDWWIYDSIWYIINNTKKQPYNILNTIFHLWWRGYVQSINNNDNIFTESLSFINHQPCSYRCIESYNIALKNLQIFKKVDKEYFLWIFKKVNKNFIYFNTENWLALEFSDLSKEEYIISYWIINDVHLEKEFKYVEKILIKDKKIYLQNKNWVLIGKISLWKNSFPYFIKFIK